MSSFLFLTDEWPDLAEPAKRAEALALTDPRASCFYARRTLEQAVAWMYDKDATLLTPYDDTLSARIHEDSFRRAVPPHILAKARLIKDLGNEAVHGGRILQPKDSGQAVRDLFHLLYWLARTYTRKGARHYDGVAFDPETLSARARQAATEKKQTAAQLRALEEQLAERDRQLKEQAEALQAERFRSEAELDAEIARLKAEVAAAKKANEAVPDDHDYSEAETRDYFIDLLLREAGWLLSNKEDVEYPVEGMPNNQGKGFVDYVLWGDDGLPLGLVEAKRTKKDPRVGRQQAKLYADCLETRFGRRPIIFYTNGYETWIWDDKKYPPRATQGFYKKDELELLIQRRSTSKPLAQASINTAIVERPYQTLAIRDVGKALENSRRRTLVVMATGAGKTRTVIALVDVLQRCNWAKRILFLADRVALVNQALGAFKTHLAGCSPVNLVTEKEKDDSRVLLSTYPTMMGLIDQMKGGARRFGPGHFDLVIIDEAHRSVYQKYGAIFTYFDSLLVGLTATPKAEVDHNTYRLFELEDGIPTSAYELNDAVSDGWLVPPRAVSVPLRFLREGIAYDNLSEDEKEDWEELDWDEEGTIPDRVDPPALNKWLFNEDTVDKVLEHLMRSGIKVDEGERLGKTIIFAKNHDHAMFIEKRFNANYPHLKGQFARVIDHYEPYAQTLLDSFSIPEKPPHIAISVDMLDTGIDVPDVVNLVFFKLVRSKTKFWQMIGRGTRLRKDLFGPGLDKEHFFVFDYCQNLEFFSQNAQGVEGSAQEPISKKLFLRRLELLQHVQKAEDIEEAHKLEQELADTLHGEVAAMNVNNFIVRPERRHVERFSERSAWHNLTETDVQEAGEHLAGLPTELEGEHITAKQFDLLMLTLQLAHLHHSPTMGSLQARVVEIASLLEEKAAIPVVNAQMALILEIQTEEFWTDVTLGELERVRKRLRELVRYIDRRGQKALYTDFTDAIGQGTEVMIGGLATSIDLAQYRKKVMHFLTEHREDPALLKVRFNEPLTPGDIAALESLLFTLGGEGSREQFEAAYGKQDSLGSFLRSLVGLDRAAAERPFSEFLADGTHTANQIRFVRYIIDHLTQNGVMDPGLLYEQPFTDVSSSGLDGVFPDEQADALITIIRQINENATATPAHQTR